MSEKLIICNLCIAFRFLTKLITALNLAIEMLCSVSLKKKGIAESKCQYS